MDRAGAAGVIEGRDWSRRLLWAGVARYTAFAVWAEWVHWASSRRLLGDAARAAGLASTSHSEAVVVLGYGNRGERANFVNRYRVRAGIRSIDPTADSVLVLCGGTVHSEVSEAEVAREYLWQQRPELAERLVRADEHRFGEVVPMKIGVALRLLWYRWRGSAPLSRSTRSRHGR